MIEMLVGLLILALVIYMVHMIIGMLNLPAQVKTIAYIIVGIVVLLYLLRLFGLYNFEMGRFT